MSLCLGTSLRQCSPVLTFRIFELVAFYVYLFFLLWWCKVRLSLAVFLFLFFLLNSVVVDAEFCPSSSLDVDLVAAGGMRDGYRSHRLWALGCYRPREAGARALSRPITLAWDQAVVTARLILHFNLARRFHQSHTPTAVVPFLEYVEMRSGVDCDRNKEGLSPPLHPLPHGSISVRG